MRPALRPRRGTRTIAHRGDPILDRAVAVAVKAPLLDAWKWSRRGSHGDITALVAATLATWGCSQRRPTYGAAGGEQPNGRFSPRSGDWRARMPENDSIRRIQAASFASRAEYRYQLVLAGISEREADLLADKAWRGFQDQARRADPAGFRTVDDYVASLAAAG